MRYSLWLSICLFLVSCEEKITDAFAYSGILEVTTNAMRYEPAAYSSTLEVRGVMDWEVDSADLADWCRLLPVNDYNGREFITVSVDSNAAIDNRETSFKVISGTQQEVVTVTQLGNIPQLYFSSDSLLIGCDTNLLKIDIVTNVEYEISANADWFSVTEEVKEHTRRILVAVSPNMGKERSGSVAFKHKNGEEQWRFAFRQLTTQAPYVPEGVARLEPNLKVAVVSASASTEGEGKNIEKSYDGDQISYYQSVYQKASEPVVLEYQFDGNAPIDYIYYYPYGGDAQKTFKVTEIWTCEQGGEYVLQKTHTFVKEGSQVVVLPRTLEKPQSIKFVVKSAYGPSRDQLVAACAEMEFYSSAMRYPRVFADPIYGSLQRSVTLEEIFAIEDPVFRNIAYHLYHRSYDEGRIRVFEAYPDVKKDYLTFCGSYGGLDHVTGIVVKAGEEIPVFVDQIGDKEAYARVFNPANPKESKNYRLFNGVNKITSDYDGHLYIRFLGDAGEEGCFHIAGGSYEGYYGLDGSNLGDRGVSEYVDAVGNHAHLLFKRENLEGKDIEALLTRYDDIVHSQQLFMGLEKYNQAFGNRVLFLESERFDILYNDHYVTCPVIKMDSLTIAQNVKEQVLWDLAVAVGTIHNHKLISWTGVTYTTPKLFALATQQALNEPLQVASRNWYLDAFKNILVPEVKLSVLKDAFYDYPEKIVPFWQLQEYASKVLGDDDFYPDVLYEARKQTSANEKTFITLVQKRLKLNLTDFFKAWGFNSTVSSSYAKAPANLKYLTSNNIEVFKYGGEPFADGYRVSQGKVTIANPQNVVVYLVKHSYVPMQIFDEATFQVEEWKDSMRIYAVGVDGSEIELKRL